MTKRTRRRFSDEQKAEAIRLAKEVGNVSQVARDLDIGRESLTRWIRQAEIDAGQGPEGARTSDETGELRRLRRENKRLRMEREILKKAAAFFAKEDDRHSS